MLQSKLTSGLVLAVVLAAGAFYTAAQQESGLTVPAHLVVTVIAHSGNQVPAVQASDVQVYENRERLQVTGWTPLQGPQAALQLFIAVDDDSQPTAFGTNMSDLRNFIQAQPATTAIAVGYLRNGTVFTTQDFTDDHAAAAKALRLPLGNNGAFGSVYLSISDLIKRWPDSKVRREVLLISDGIDELGSFGVSNPYVDEAVQKAQQNGIILFAIYTPGFGRHYRSFWRMNLGQTYLSQLTDETGGAAYFLGFQAPVSYAPYLDDISQRLNHQYLLTFAAPAPSKPKLVPIRLRTELPNVELISADQAWVGK
ncbi:MAG TPA: hypothetical protein VJP87_13000 [Candidatus Acidoferrales bacterium]|nr:hypothetical protein [Candidatus Acidoferrales bacterium]